MQKYVERNITLLLVTVHTCTYYHFGIVHTIGVKLFMNSHFHLRAKKQIFIDIFFNCHTEYFILDMQNVDGKAKFSRQENMTIKDLPFKIDFMAKTDCFIITLFVKSTQHNKVAQNAVHILKFEISKSHKRNETKNIRLSVISFQSINQVL